MCQGIIYRATNLINGKIYIGQTTGGLEARKKEHYRMVKCDNQIYFYNAIRKYGIENFYWEIIYECEDVLLDMMETFKIIVCHSHYTENGYNLTWGGKGRRGFKLTEEQIRKRSETNRGRKRSEDTKRKMSVAQKGRIMSEEARQKMSDAHKGIPLTEDQKQKIGKSRKGHIVSEETRKKIGDANRGRKHSEKAKRKMSKAKKGKPIHKKIKDV